MTTWTDVDGETYEDRRIERMQPTMTCRNCPGRPLVDDGYGGLVHADDFRYICNPRDKKSKMAEAKT